MRIKGIEVKQREEAKMKTRQSFFFDLFSREIIASILLDKVCRIGGD